MSKKIRPQDVARQLDYDISDAAEFASNLLEDVNDHNLALAIKAVNVEMYDLACEFIQIEKEHRAAGHLTTELQERRNKLLDELEGAVDA